MPLSTDEEESTDLNERIWHPEDRLSISFQNENLTAELLHKGNKYDKELLAIVPDLITVLDSQSGSSLGTHEYRYGVSLNIHFFMTVLLKIRNKK